jgi:hypothetical protein
MPLALFVLDNVGLGCVSCRLPWHGQKRRDMSFVALACHTEGVPI